ncbi:MAG: HlyD family efflux transporter periplasmic adaptor subunit [Candidatus Tantalella remota]|nr:HlyD family efflux transporter periplasmic adaptor subunit [Candidatus Tantalella remota]
MRLRKIEAFNPTKTQAERQKGKKGLPKTAKFLIFILVMASPFIIWKAMTFNAIYSNGIVMGQLELEMGKLTASEITSPVAGEITELYAETGDRIEKGSLLAVIEPTALPEEKSSRANIRAKAEEVIVNKYRKVGDTVAKGDAVYGTLPVGAYWVEAFVPEKYINQLSIGKRAQVFTPSSRNKFNGRIDAVSAEIETMPKMFAKYYFSPKRVFRVRISFTDKKIPPDFLKFGMTVKCKLYKR